MKKIKGAWGWFRDNLVVILVGVVAVLGAGIFWGYHNKKIRSLESEVAIKEAHRQVAGLDARREVLEVQAEENAEAIGVVQEQRRHIQRQVAALDHDVSEMSDDEVEEAFRDMY